MYVELTINKNNLPKDSFSKVEAELHKRIKDKWPLAGVVLKKADNNNLIVNCQEKGVKGKVSSVIEEMFDEADYWLYE